MSDMKKELLDAIECCRANDQCDRCPLRDAICDEFFVEMVKMPEKLVDMIEEELAE